MTDSFGFTDHPPAHLDNRIVGNNSIHAINGC